MDGVLAGDPAETELLDAARRGDDQAFGTLMEPHLRALHLHCYRMLGSFDDAEEALQEVLVRSWRGLGSFEGRAPLRHWLVRIATNTCLKVIEREGRRPVVAGEVGFLQPYPDRLLDQAAADDPAAVVEGRESVALAFIVALQRLPATQRAALILKDVLGWSSAEVAELLNSSAPAVDSLLQRARGRLGTATGSRRVLDERDEVVLGRFVDAWRRCDFAGLAVLLREDAVLRMPPEDIVISGREQIIEFLSTVPADGRIDLIRLTATRANGHLALAAHGPGETGPHSGYGVMAFTFAGGLMDTITGFPDPGLFRHFGLPTTLP